MKTKLLLTIALFCAQSFAQGVQNSPGVSGEGTTFPGPKTFTGGLSSNSFGSCAVLDFALCASAVDASGNPSFIAQGSAGNKLTITGTGLVAYIQGVYQTGTGTYTDAITGLGSSTFNYVYVKQDTANANLALADFAATILAPVYSYKTPTACTGATASAPQYWFDLSTYQWKVSTAAACSFSVASPQVLFLGVVWITAVPAVAGVAHEPLSLSPRRRFELFGDGFDAQNAGSDITKQERTSGTTTVDNWHTYTSFEMTGATINPTTAAASGATSGILIAWSQNPVLIVNTSVLKADAKGIAGAAAVTSACAAGTSGGLGGAAGGGGGASATNAGCTGGSRRVFYEFGTSTGGGVLGGIGANGSNGTSNPSNTGPSFCSGAGFDLVAPSGATGGGDGAASSGGAGGNGAGAIIVKAPAVVLDASSTLSANGAVGGNGGGTNGGGGGGGGGGFVVTCAGYASLAGTNTAAGGAGGTKAGTGGNGGNGLAGLVQNVKIW